MRALSAQVARYLETENLAALRSLNSSFGSWSGFFAIAEDISASSSYSILSVEGPRATAQVNFTLRFVNTTNEGRRDELPVSQRWTLERRVSDWQLVGVQ